MLAQRILPARLPSRRGSRTITDLRGASLPRLTMAQSSHRTARRRVAAILMATAAVCGADAATPDTPQTPASPLRPPERTVAARDDAGGRPRAGALGFDWLRPRSAACRPVSDRLVQRFARCRREAGAFGLDDAVYVCTVGDRSEYLVFDDRRACERNLEAMHANAP